MKAYLAHCRGPAGNKRRFWTDDAASEEAFRQRLLNDFPAELSVILIRRMSPLEALHARREAEASEE